MMDRPTTQTNEMQGSVLSDISVYVKRKHLLQSLDVSLVNRLAFTKDFSVLHWTFGDEYARSDPGNPRGNV